MGRKCQKREKDKEDNIAARTPTLLPHIHLVYGNAVWDHQHESHFTNEKAEGTELRHTRGSSGPRLGMKDGRPEKGGGSGGSGLSSRSLRLCPLLSPQLSSLPWWARFPSTPKTYWAVGQVGRSFSGE